eukprot:SAG22_NODE_625_length_8437_cov_5.263133_6_plen_260_part_00
MASRGYVHHGRAAGAGAGERVPPLVAAAIAGDHGAVQGLLASGSVAVDETDSRGCTALMYACSDRADPTLVGMLCAAGAHLSASFANARGETAESLTRKYAPRSVQYVLLPLLDAAARLQFEQLLAFSKGYSLRLGSESDSVPELDADVMHLVGRIVGACWQRLAFGLRTRVWDRFFLETTELQRRAQAQAWSERRNRTRAQRIQVCQISAPAAPNRTDRSLAGGTAAYLRRPPRKASKPKTMAELIREAEARNKLGRY